MKIVKIFMVGMLLLCVIGIVMLHDTQFVEAATYQCHIDDMYNFRINQEFDIETTLLRNNNENNNYYGYINIVNPENELVVEHEELNNTGVNGKYLYYDHSSSRVGEHFIIVRFYDEPINISDNNNVVVECVNSYKVGFVDEITFGQCPASEKGQDNMWYALTILILIGIAGMFFRSVVLTGVSGLILVFMTLIVWSCGVILGVITILFGLIYIVISLNYQV